MSVAEPVGQEGTCEGDYVMATKNKQRIESPAQMALARQIATDLFADGGNQSRQADRLVLEIRGLYSGGWCKQAVINLIYSHLIGDLPTS